MLRKIKKATLGISVATAMAITPSSLQAGAGEGLSESTSSMIEQPSYEKQLNRINTGINFIRLSHDVIENMPISEDAEWVDKTVQTLNRDMIKQTLALDEVRNDAYYSTVMLTNAILGRPDISMTPAVIRLYYVASVIYKNKSNGHPDFHIPDMNEFPDVTNLDTFVRFKKDPQVQLIDVEAKTGNLHPNASEAVVALLPEATQEEAKLAKEEMEAAREEFQQAKENVEMLKIWIEDEKNANDPDLENKKKGLELAEAKDEEAEALYNEKKSIYLAILDRGAEEIQANFDEEKVKLAIKVDKLLELVDDGAINAISLFTAAGIGIYRGYEQVENEMKAILIAQGLSTLVGNQKQFLIERYERMIKGTLMAVPNISIGTYYVVAARGRISTYKDVVGAVMDGAEAKSEAEKAALEMQQIEEAQADAKTSAQDIEQK
jgi:hypothetical protein